MSKTVSKVLLRSYLSSEFNGLLVFWIISVLHSFHDVLVVKILEFVNSLCCIWTDWSSESVFTDLNSVKIKQFLEFKNK